MAAFVAVASLEQTLERLLINYPRDLIPTNEIRSLYNDVQSLRDSLEKDPKFLKINEEQIRDGAWKIEDLLESYILDLLPLVSESGRSLGDECRTRKTLFEEELMSPMAAVKDFKAEYTASQRYITELERLFPTNLSRLGKRITDAALKLKDSLEGLGERERSQIGDEYHALKSLSRDLKEAIEKEIISLNSTVWKIMEHRYHEQQKSLLDDVDGLQSEEMVGMEDELQRLLDRCVSGPSHLSGIPIHGMAGIGKTALAKRFYNHPNLSRHFRARAFIRIGQEADFSMRVVLRSLLRSIDPSYLDEVNEESNDVDQLSLRLYKSLRSQRYLIVLDDVWDNRTWDGLVSSLPDHRNGSRVLLTTRMGDVADCICKSTMSDFGISFRICFLNKEESWNLLRETVFGLGDSSSSCPIALERIGKKIAENCEGLPLAIIAVGRHLSGAEKTPSLEYWKKVAENHNSLVFASAQDEATITRTLLKSLKNLPHPLRACFLYMGVFSEMNNIRVSNLVNLLAAEGFITSDSYKNKVLREEMNNIQASELINLLDSEESIASDFSIKSLQLVKELVSQSLVLAHEWSWSNKIKTCGIHYVFRGLCVTEGEKLKLFHSMYSFIDSLAERTRSQRRLCVHNNVLLGINDFSTASTTRSLLCTGPFHHYPLPKLCLGLKLLRVLYAVTIRFYEFPFQVLKLVHLRYLAFTYNGGQIPAFISGLWNLEFLIICRTLIVLSSRDPSSYLPMEIWDMRELRHLQVEGSDLPNPSSYVATELPHLLTLKDVSACSCTEEVFRRLPNLKKLGIRIVVGLDKDEDLRPFDHLYLLSQLESFKCVVPNPSASCKRILVLPNSISNFPSTLRKLTLSGCGFGWNDMALIGALPNLEVLKLHCYAFRGPLWETHRVIFERLEFLLIEDLDLVCWKVGYESFRKLESLIIRHCYLLEEIPLDFGNIPYLQMIEVTNSRRSAMDSAKRIQRRREINGKIGPQVRVGYSIKQ